MGMSFVYYTVKETINELNIYKNDRFYKNNNQWVNVKTGKYLPKYIIPENNPYFPRETIYRDYTEDDVITYNIYNSRFGNKPTKKHIYKGKVLNVHADSVSVLRSGTEKQMDIVKFDDIISKSEMYYFISSTGKIQHAYTGVDKDVDNFRIKSHNKYATKDAAYDALNKILNA